MVDDLASRRARLEAEREEQKAFYEREIADARQKGLSDHASRLAERQASNLQRIETDLRAVERAERTGMTYAQASRAEGKAQFREESAALSGEARTSFERQREEVRARVYLSRPERLRNEELTTEARRVVAERERRDAAAVSLGRSSGAVVLSERGRRQMARFEEGRRNRAALQARRASPVVSGAFSSSQGFESRADANISLVGGGVGFEAAPSFPTRPRGTLTAADISFSQRSGFSQFRYDVLRGASLQPVEGSVTSQGVQALASVYSASGLPRLGSAVGRLYAYAASRPFWQAAAALPTVAVGTGLGVREADIRATSASSGLSREQIVAGRRAALNPDNVGLSSISPLFTSSEDYRAAFSRGAGVEVPLSVSEQSRRTTGILEGSLIASPGAAGEVIGNRLLSVAPNVERRYSSLFRTGFFRIGGAGAVEAPLQVTQATIGRGRPPTAQELAVGSAFGFGTAGLIGGSIFASGALGRTRQAAFLGGIANVADPTEPLSDAFARSARSFSPASARVFSFDFPGARGGRSESREFVAFRAEPAGVDRPPSFVPSSTLRGVYPRASPPRISARPRVSSFGAFRSRPVSLSRDDTFSRPSARPDVPSYVPTETPVTPSVPITPRVRVPVTSRPSVPFEPLIPVRPPVTPRIPTYPEVPTRTDIPVVVTTPYAGFPLAAGSLYGYGRGRVGSRRGFSYAPSLQAIAFNIRAPRGSRRQALFSGLEFRGV